MQHFMLFPLCCCKEQLSSIMPVLSDIYIPCNANGTDDFLGGGAGGFLLVGLDFLGTVIDE